MREYRLVRNGCATAYLKDEHLNTIAMILPLSKHGHDGETAVLDMIEAMVSLLNAVIEANAIMDRV